MTNQQLPLTILQILQVLALSVLQFCTFIIKQLGKLALIAYFVLGLLFLGARYWIFPNINNWRPQLENRLSDALDMRVSLGQIAIDWKGLHPKLSAQNIQLNDNQNQPLLAISDVRATLSWQTLLSGSLQLLSLEANGLDLSVRKNQNGTVSVLGRAINTDESDVASQAPDSKLEWLLAQRNIVLRTATVRWLDDSRQAPPLVLNQLVLQLNRSDQDHRFLLQAELPKSLGDTLDIRGELLANPTADADRQDRLQGRGQIYTHIENMQPSGWLPWLDVPDALKSGQLSVQGWARFDAGHFTSFASDIRIQGGHWAAADYGVQAQSLDVFVSGPWQVLQPWLQSAAQESAAKAKPADPQGVAYQVRAQGVEVQAPGVFDRPLVLDQLASRGTVHGPDADWRVDASSLDLSNADLQASLQGHWQQHNTGSAGLADIQGKIHRLSIPSIVHYLPNSVNVDARDWMRHGLLAGQVQNATLTLNGTLDDFPFAEDAGGVFKLSGPYSGAVIDYLPTTETDLGWPRLEDMQGRLVMHGADLGLFADQAVMRPVSGGASIQLHDLQARIPNLEHNSVLSIAGQSNADSSAYLALIANSPLSSLLDHQFDEARASGQWNVPLNLTIPLLHSRDTTVQGAINFSGGSLQLMPEMPVFSKLDGSLAFTDTGFSASGLKGQFLGGPVAIDGGVGGAFKGLLLKGSAQAPAIREYVGLEGMKRLSGQVDYQVRLSQGKNRAFLLDMKSDLQGLALDFPPPLNKEAGQRLPLQVSWEPDSGRRNRVLKVLLGTQVQADLLHQVDAKNGSYFHTGAVALNQAIKLPETGLALDLQYSRVDADAWHKVVNEFSNPLPGVEQTRNRPLLPPVQQFRLQTDKLLVQGLELDILTFTAFQPEAQNWRADISSTQTAGTLFWREAHGKVAGRIDARFDRLALGVAPSSDAPSEALPLQETQNYQINDDLDIPGINLYVRKFYLYGQEAGELSLVGVNQARGNLWKLESLTLKSPDAELSGSGLWRLSGPDRGLTLDAQVQIGNLGNYLDQIGYQNLMEAGDGTVKGKLEWRNMPWRFSEVDLNGEVEFSLKKGRFSALNSRSARVLELLSLQSVKRLANLSFDPSGLTRDGFPYDDLLGTVRINDGLMSTKNYRVIGPVGTIVLGGTINLLSEQMDLEAVVIPNLDISGAAIAAGIAINPIVGVGAFLTQWLLQAPLAKAMTVQYKVAGQWSNPTISELSTTTEESKKGAVVPNTTAPETRIEH